MLLLIPTTNNANGQENVYYYFEINENRDAIKAKKIIRLSYFTFWSEKEWWNDLDKEEKDKYESIITNISKTFTESYKNRIKQLTTLAHKNEKGYSIPVVIMPLEDDVFYNTLKTGSTYKIIINSKKLLHKDFPMFLSMAFIETKIETIRQKMPATNEEIIIKHIIKNALPATAQNTYFAKHNYDQFNNKLFRTKHWVALFTYFIAENTNEKFFPELVKSNKKGFEAIDEALIKASSKETFESLFKQWSLAIVSTPSLLTNKEDIKLYENEFIQSYIFSGFDNQTIDNKQETLRIKPHSTKFIKYIPKKLGVDKATKNILKIRVQPTQYPSTINYITTDINNQKTVYQHTITTGSDKPIEIDLFGTYIMSVTIILENPKATEKPIKIHEYQESYLQNGDIIQYKNDIFVIKNEFIKKIPSPDVFNSYGHLRWEDVQEIDTFNIKKYKQSTLVKTLNSSRVFEIDKNGVLHWLDISPSQFEKSNRKWNQIFIVNDYEINQYKEGEKYIV